MMGNIQSSIPADKVYDIGSVVVINADGEITKNRVLGNAYSKGSVISSGNVSASGVGYVEIDSYDEVTGELKIVGSSATYRVSSDTVVTFSDKSNETIELVETSVLSTTNKNYYQNDDKTLPLRVVLCVSDSSDSEDTYDVHFAMLVRD